MDMEVWNPMDKVLASGMAKQLIESKESCPVEPHTNLFLSIEFVKVVISSKYLRYAGAIWLVFLVLHLLLIRFYVFKFVLH